MSLHDEPGALASPGVERVDLGGGAFVLRSREPLGATARAVGEWLERWSRETPDAPFLAERDAGGGWRRLSYGQAREQVGRLAQGLLDRGLPDGAPVVILSDNSIDHALLSLAAMHVGRAVCAVTPAYSRMTQDHRKLASILAALRPALVYAADAKVYGAAIVATGTRAPVFASANADALPGAESLAALSSRSETPAVRAAFEAITPQTHAKYLLTSGSTGVPKVVINTHAMLTANQQQILQCWRFLEREKPRLLDWLPWSHTFGANHNFNMALAHGGSIAIDEGRPAPGLVEKTVRNLREVKPNLYFNVPRGFDMLLPFLEADDALAAEVFGQMRLLFYAGAALPQATWERLEAVALRCGATPPWFTSAWGATETSPLLTSVHWRIARAGCIGLPVPGTEIKFVPNGGKLELRVKGPQVFAGYRDAPELTAAAFDDDGYYRIGDAGRLIDEARPEAGIAFDGRVAEDFKLTSGTWVSVGTLRLKVVSALSPLAQDVVITGHDRDEIGVLVFPGPQAKAMAPDALRSAIARQACGDQRGRRRRLVADRAARAAARRAAEPRRRRDHRQGLRQPARGARAPARQGRDPVPFGTGRRGNRPRRLNPYRQSRRKGLPHARTAHRPASLDRLRHADRARAGARHRQHHLHLDPGRQAAAASGARRARRIGLFLAMFMRIGLLLVLSWIVGLTAPLFTVLGAGDLRPRPDPDRRRPVPGLEEHHRDPPAHRRRGRPRVERGQGDLRRGDPADHDHRHGVLARLDHHRGRHGRRAGGDDRRGDRLGRPDDAVRRRDRPLRVRRIRRSRCWRCRSCSSSAWCSIAEGFDHHVPKGYIYFAMAFSVAVEMLNIRMRKRVEPSRCRCRCSTRARPRRGHRREGRLRHR